MFAQVYLLFALSVHGCLQNQAVLPLEVQRILVTNISCKTACEKVIEAKVPGLKQILFDPTDESLIAQGTAPSLKAVRKILAKIDVRELMVRKFSVTNTDAKTLVDKIQKPFDGVDLIVFDPTDNAVLARGTGKGLDRLEHVIKGLDKK
jgi:hypothetical protein